VGNLFQQNLPQCLCLLNPLLLLNQEQWALQAVEVLLLCLLNQLLLSFPKKILLQE
jgi:hypothetical protein